MTKKFKNYAIKVLWIFLCFLIYFLFVAINSTAIDFITYDICGVTIFHDLLIFDNTLVGYGIVGLCAFLLSLKLLYLILHIFYYKIYTGKYNWYKFFRDREKQQKLQNNIEWKQYLKDINNKG